MATPESLAWRVPLGHLSPVPDSTLLRNCSFASSGGRIVVIVKQGAQELTLFAGGMTVGDMLVRQDQSISGTHSSPNSRTTVGKSDPMNRLDGQLRFLRDDAQ